MNIILEKSKIKESSEIKITGSKSESNRLLLLQSLYPQLQINNVSNSDDSELMSKALRSFNNEIDIHHAGTAMRFLTAYFAIQEGREVVLTGSSRMKERPIKILVEALRQMGAKIQYTENEGFPPLKIRGAKILESKVTLAANVSSQYISALLLVASKLENGIELNLEGKITSIPYINMTLNLLNQIGVETIFENNCIAIKPKLGSIHSQRLTVESDWSSASYFFSIVALSDVGTRIKLSAYKENSLQGDSVLTELYKSFGVETKFLDNSIILIKSEEASNHNLKFELSNSPDIAQTIAVTAFALGIECNLMGLHTLKIKETDRLVALQSELGKFGAEILITNDSLHLQPSKSIIANVSVATYNDHRMAMAFAPLALRVPFTIENADVVSKSYPDFWKDLEQIGFEYK